jgi:hypothetical protein
VGRTSVLTPWGGEFGDYRALGGMRIPTRATVYWELDQGRFVYWRDGDLGRRARRAVRRLIR